MDGVISSGTEVNTADFDSNIKLSLYRLGEALRAPGI
jgi:hypothetical protein